MEWSRINGSKYASESDEGYRISMAIVDANGREVFTAWAPGRWHGQNWMPIEYCSNVEAAVAACDRHIKGG